MTERYEYRILSEPGHPGLRRMILCSLILHAVIFAAFVYFPNLGRSKAMMLPVYDVSLVSPSEIGLEKKTSLPVTKRSKRRIVSKSRSLAKPERMAKDSGKRMVSVRKPSFELPESIESPKQSVTLAQKDEKPPRLEVSEPVTREKERQPASPGPPAVSFPARAPLNWRVQTSLISQYNMVVRQRVKENWTAYLADKPLMAAVLIQVAPDGTIEDIRLEKSSGDPYFDESILRALRKTLLPPPPREIMDYQPFRIRFFSEEMS